MCQGVHVPVFLCVYMHCTDYVVHRGCELVWILCVCVCVCVCVLTCICTARLYQQANPLLPFHSCNGLDTYANSVFILLFISIDSRTRALRQGLR